MSLGMNTATGGFVCHKCQVRGKLPEDLLDLVPYEAMDPGEKPEDITITMPEGFYPLFEEPGVSAQFLDPYRGYILGRAISEQSGFDVQIGAVTGGWYAGRVVIPHWDWANDKLVGWVARTVFGGGDKPKYLYPKGMHRDLMWGEDALQRETDEPALIVEGCFDALPYWPEAIACLGKPRLSHIPAILAAKRPVAIVLDGDAWEEGWALAMKLNFMAQAAELTVRVGCVRLASGEDPGALAEGGRGAELMARARESV